MFKKVPPRIAVIGLGYVGLPLAIGLAKHFEVTGFDIKQKRIQDLKAGIDSTGEVSEALLRATTLSLTSQSEDLNDHDIFIITVPTPITQDFRPDLTALEKASETVGKALQKDAIVVYESTVYPGVTEEFCAPLLEKASGLKAGEDFFLGYSPERINPGDRVHNLGTITKVVAGQTPDVTTFLGEIYGSLNNGNIFVAKDIKTAEAAKVIENAQRDINIAFINEITTIFARLGLSVYDVLDAAKTKWNFLNFTPGLVGGHCIGVDPYYLAHASRVLGHEPEVILAGRRINEQMGPIIAEMIATRLNRDYQKKNGRILILGLTFKEDVPDLRNTKVIDVITTLQQKGFSVDVHDPLADPEEAQSLYGIMLYSHLEGLHAYDCVLGAVPHHAYKSFDTRVFERLLSNDGILADMKRLWSSVPLTGCRVYWTL